MTRKATQLSGHWQGHFAYAVDPNALTPTALKLDVEGDAVTGEGVDNDGPFTVTGTFDAARSTVRWQKRYAGRHGTRVAYVGRLDAASQEITGRWRVINTSVWGRFTLRPGERVGAVLERDTSKAEDFLKRRAEEWRSLCTVDIEALRFDGERAMLEPLLRDPDYVNALARVQETRDELSSAIRASGPSMTRVRLRRPMVPGLFDLLDRCVKVLGLKAPVDLYVTNDGAFNACVTVTRDRRIVIEVTSGAINHLAPAEMLYVLGHEIGHALLGHLETPHVEGDAVIGITALRSFALQRYEEVSADRVGLLCCDDVEAALRAEFILTTGITNRDALGDVRAFVEHARRAIEAIDSRDAEALSGFDTHPYGEMRALAIDLFSRSKTLAALVGREGAALSEEKMEREVARLMRLMNPSVMEAGLKDSDIAEFVVLAALAVAEATGGVSASERRALKKLAQGRTELIEKAQSLPFEEQQLRLVELAEVLTTTLPIMDRAAIVADLTVVARVDGRVSARERLALNGIAELLAVPFGGVDDTLDSAEHGID